MLTEAQMLAAERLIIEIENISNAVVLINELGHAIGMPPIAIRFAGAPRVLSGEHHYHALVNSIICAEYERRLPIIESINASRKPERLAA